MKTWNLFNRDKRGNVAVSMLSSVIAGVMAASLSVVAATTTLATSDARVQSQGNSTSLASSVDMLDKVRADGLRNGNSAAVAADSWAQGRDGNAWSQSNYTGEKVTTQAVKDVEGKTTSLGRHDGGLLDAIAKSEKLGNRDTPIRNFSASYVIGYDDAGNPVWSDHSGTMSMRLGKVVSSGARTCAISLDGMGTGSDEGKNEAWCWGANSHGQVGDGSTRDAYSPVLIAPGVKFDELFVSDLTTCGITAAGGKNKDGSEIPAGELRCWGDNSLGQIDSSITSKIVLEPVIVDKPNKYAQVAVGSHGISGITLDGQVRASGQLTRDASAKWKTMATGARVLAGYGAKPQIAADSQGACFVNNDKELNCWSTNNLGIVQGGKSPDRVPYRETNSESDELKVVTGVFIPEDGSGTTTLRFKPVGQPSFDDGNGVTKVATNVDRVYMAPEDQKTKPSVACTVDTSGVGKCFSSVAGSEANGASFDDVTDVALSLDKVCMTTTSEVKCFSSGDTTSINEVWKDIEASTGNTGTFCGITDTNRVKCMGNNDFAQASGDSNKSGVVSPPVLVIDERYPNMSSLAMGDSTVCSAGGEYTPFSGCWGRGDLGQLGRGDNPLIGAAAKVFPRSHDYRSLYGFVSGGMPIVKGQ